MNAISKALSEVYYNIPMEIINLGFNDNPIYATQSIDETIIARVIRPRVLMDCNIVGGVEVYINLLYCNILDYSTNYGNEYLIEVPKNVTNNRSLVSVLSLFYNNSKFGIEDGSSGELAPILMKQMRTASPPTLISTTRLELIAENKVLVSDPSTIIVGGIMKCVLENEDNLSNLSPRSYLSFGKLVTLAVKAHIYNYLRVKLGSGYIQSGHEIGVVNDVIADYSSANEDYYQYINEVWAKVMFHNDSERLSNHINGML